MKKKFLIALFAVFIPLVIIMTGCASKPVDVKGKSFVFDRAYVRWGNEITAEEKTEILAVEEMTEEEFFEALRADIALEVGDVIFIFNEDGTCLLTSDTEGVVPTTYTYEQSEDLNTINLTKPETNSKLKIEFSNGQYRIVLGENEEGLCYYAYLKLV